jgi:hypothetical protein
MVLVTLADDSSSVTVGSSTVTGPLTFWAGEVVKDSTTYSNGCLLVQGSLVKVTSDIGPVHAFAWPYVCVFLVALAWITARQR